MEENNSIFIDTSFWIALFNPTDNLHQKALKIAQKLDKQNNLFFISNFIFLEVVTVLSQRVGKKTALEVGNYLLSDSRINLIHIDENLNDRTWQRFKEIKSKNASFVDASIIETMKMQRLTDLLTFDTKDFSVLAKNRNINLIAI